MSCGVVRDLPSAALSNLIMNATSDWDSSVGNGNRSTSQSVRSGPGRGGDLAEFCGFQPLRDFIGKRLCELSD
jgi:hypothetical protein